MKTQNRGIHNFRMIAAIMVVAIHCFPFQDIAPILDTTITLTLFRVAVPFFFMITGFYLLGPLAKKQEFPQKLKVQQFLKKQLRLYCVINLIYLPLALYSGFISLNMPITELLQLILFEGFLYHLWYFPALILGVLIVSQLLKKISLSKVLLISFLLYLIGLGGDSWWGITEQLPFVNQFYELIFYLFGGTRNGLFFAPLFLSLGAFAYSKRDLKNPKVIFLVLSLVGLLLEGYLLHQFSTPRHDSMYLLLPLVMYFLFQTIYHWQPRKIMADAATISLGIYVLHPYVIAVIHFLGNRIPLLANSLVNFIAVLVITYCLTIFLIKLRSILQHKFAKKTAPVARSSKILSTKALQHNLNEIKKVIPETTKIMPVIKANAYGTDAIVFAKKLEQSGVDFFAVATIDEGIALRKAGIASQILILGYTTPKRIQELKKYSLTQTIVSEEHADALNHQKVKISCHLKIDTGMHRLGVSADTEIIAALYQLPYLSIQGIYSHLASADDNSVEAVARTKNQIAIFDQLLQALKSKKIQHGVTHLQSSYGILNYPELQYDYVRPGIILYGVLSSANDHSKINLNLQPVIELRAMLISKKNVHAGDYLGYGLDTKLAEKKLIGVVSIGYCDGIPRNLSDRGLQLVFAGQTLPQIGRICMDLLLVDLTHAPDIPLEAELTVLSNFAKVATATQTITNEILSRLGNRLETQLLK